MRVLFILKKFQSKLFDFFLSTHPFIFSSASAVREAAMYALSKVADALKAIASMVTGYADERHRFEILLLTFLSNLSALQMPRRQFHHIANILLSTLTAVEYKAVSELHTSGAALCALSADLPPSVENVLITVIDFKAGKLCFDDLAHLGPLARVEPKSGVYFSGDQKKRRQQHTETRSIVSTDGKEDHPVPITQIEVENGAADDKGQESDEDEIEVLQKSKTVKEVNLEDFEKQRVNNRSDFKAKKLLRSWILKRREAAASRAVAEPDMKVSSIRDDLMKQIEVSSMEKKYLFFSILIAICQG